MNMNGWRGSLAQIPRWIDRAEGYLLFPDTGACIYCSQPAGPGLAVCPACALEEARLRADGCLHTGPCDCRYAYVFDGPIRSAVHTFKFNGKKWMFRYLAARMEPIFPKDAQAIAFVPLHWTRRLLRGYNQSELLARELARHFGLPLIPALRRTRRTQKQSTLSGHARRENVCDAFAPRNGQAALAGKHVALVDDVCTSGATIAQCATALRSMGARQVTGVCLAAGKTAANQMEESP